MPFTVSALVTLDDCDKVILLAQSEKSSLEVRKTNLIYKQTGFAETSSEVEADLAVVNAQLPAVITLISTLPDGKEKNHRIAERKGLEYRLSLLELKRENYGPAALIERESELSRIELQIVDLNALLALVETHRAGLSA